MSDREELDAMPVMPDMDHEVAGWISEYRKSYPSSLRQHRNMARLREQLDGESQKRRSWRWAWMFVSIATGLSIFAYFLSTKTLLLEGKQKGEHLEASHHLRDEDSSLTADRRKIGRSNGRGRAGDLSPNAPMAVASSDEGEQEQTDTLDWLEQIEVFDEEEASVVPTSNDVKGVRGKRVRPRKNVGRESSGSESEFQPMAEGKIVAEEDRLKLELVLLKEIRAAMIAKDFAAVLEGVQRHEEKFQGGVFREERRAWKAVAQCHLGRSAAGRRSAAKFLRMHPKSHHAESVLSACAMTAESGLKIQEKK